LAYGFVDGAVGFVEVEREEKDCWEFSQWESFDDRVDNHDLIEAIKNATCLMFIIEKIVIDLNEVIKK
jgi:hypothetical protein